MQPAIDLNLLVALDALLEEGTVTGAAAKLHLSVPAMSRTLGRIRKALGDPVLVRSGQGMVPTPRAVALRTRVHALVEEAHSLFARTDPTDVAALTRAFTVLAQDEIVHTAGARLLARLRDQAPGVTLRFLSEPPADAVPLRDSHVDLQIGTITRAPPEARIEPLLSDRLVGVVRPGHPLARGPVTVRRFLGARHLTVSRRGRLHGPLDEHLAKHGLDRTVAASTPTLTAALFLLADADVVGMVPESLCRDAIRALGLATFDIPVELPPIEIAQAWHPRYDADPAHTWLRSCVRDVVRRPAERA